MTIRRSLVLGLAASAIALPAVAAVALAEGQGPVASACEADIVSYCAGKEHGQGEPRTCLEDNRARLSQACRSALDSTGPGKGPAAGAGAGQGQTK